MGFEMGTLGDYIKVQGGFAYKSKDFQDSGANKVLKIKNVRFGHVDYGDTAYISDTLAKETQAWSTNEGDILISMTGSGPNAPQSLVGRVARVWENEDKAWINQRVGRIVLRKENTINPDFVYYLLSQKSSQDFWFPTRRVVQTKPISLARQLKCCLAQLSALKKVLV